MTNTNVSESAPSFEVEGSPLDLEAEIARINDLTVAAKKHEEEGHQRTYQRLADMLRFVKRFHNNPLYAEAWNKVRKERQISKPRKGANEICQYTKVLAGKFVTEPAKDGSEGGSVTRWKPNRFSERAAKILRWCVENGVTSEEAADRIAHYADRDYPEDKGMLGIERADTRAHPSTPRVSKLKEAEKKAAQATEGLFELPSSLESHVNVRGGYSVVILRHDENGTTLLGDAGLSANRVITAVKRQKDAFKAGKTAQVVVTPDLLEKYRARLAEKADTADTD